MLVDCHSPWSCCLIYNFYPPAFFPLIDECRKPWKSFVFSYSCHFGPWIQDHLSSGLCAWQRNHSCEQFSYQQSYPFPTAPPVDPFAKIRVDDCGKTKGCFRYGKPGCNAETCDYFLSYRRIGADVEFELSADTDGWVAVGFSSDKKMGGDDVMACVHDDNGRVRIQHFYNVGQWAKEIQRNPARDEEGVFENNRVTCRFKRPVYVPREETIVDLHLSWYYLFAWGPAIQGSITRHDIDSPPVSERVVSIYKYEDIFMPSAAYQTFSSPFCLLLIVALTFYLLMGTP
uniref:Ferric chelate reductase 1 like n=1 Tax=Ficedula albicollis TaxID=59894 RepID=A0A803W955_FICAL